MFDSEVFGHEAGSFTRAQKRRIGKIEHANNGALFLDKIENTPLAMQVKFLRVLQERKLERLGSNELVTVSFRVVAATKESLGKWSDEGKFRSDLYYRLNVVTIDLPSPCCCSTSRRWPARASIGLNRHGPRGNCAGGWKPTGAATCGN